MRSRNSFPALGRVLVAGGILSLLAPLTAAPPPPSPSELPAPVKSPLSPAESLLQLRIAAGLKVELAAAEPEVIDPVSIAFDEAGRLWAVEMTDYPNGPAPGEPPRSRIRLLDDRDGDGRYETAVVFADKLLFATGVQPWRGGVIVTLAGEIAYFKDTDGDGRSDLRETWFRGFVQENPQLRANHPRFALDNGIYVANGLRSGSIVSTPEKWGKERPAVSLNGMDFRFDPLTGESAAVSGMGQFGMTFDDFGRRFICSNRNPCKQIVLEDRYLKRNPFLGVRDVGADVSPAAADSRVFALSRAWTTSTQHAGQFTAACGVTIYRGDTLSAAFQGNSFTCEPTGNLVHRDVLEPSGATFTSRPGQDGSEFLASPDEWFRPVDLANGPDGALYVADMYRAVIEHPQWVPDELKNRPDQDFGNDRGRIYRVVSVADAVARSRRGKVNLGEAATGDLVALLRHPNAWHRETAARLLYERQDAAAAPALEELVKTATEPVARVHALWALQGLGKLSAETILAALDDAHPRVREQAVLLSEGRLNESPELRNKLLALSQADDPRLRFQVALTLGQLPADPEMLDALGKIALRGTADEWTRRAVLSAIPEQPAALLVNLLGKPEFAHQEADPNLQLLVKELAELIGARNKPAEMEPVFQKLAGRPARGTASGRLISLAAVNGMGQGAARRGGSLAATINTLPGDKAAVQQALQDVFAAAVQLAQDEQAPELQRQAALTALQFAGFEAAGPALLHLAQAASAQSIRLRAIDVLAAYREPRIGPALLENFAAQTPAVRRAVLQALTRDPERTKLLLAEIAAKRITVAELDPARIRELTNHSDPGIKKEAQALLAAALPADRKQVLETYQQALREKADAGRGRQIFEKNCTACHKIGNLGVDVAPDIADSRTKTPAMLLTDILSPNQAIDNNYLSYTVVTHDGKTQTGIIATETASSITLRQPENKTEIILRQDIEELRSNGISLMPEGLEKNISVAQMADLIAFIKNWRYLDGQVPLGPAGK